MAGIAKYIFPGGELASLAEILASLARTGRLGLYHGFCEASFLHRHIGTVQLLLAKAANRRVLFGEPWKEGNLDDAPARQDTFPFLEVDAHRPPLRDPDSRLHDSRAR